MSLVSLERMEIILFVSDMNSEVNFYHNILGLPVRYPARLADYSDQMWVELECGDCILALHGGAKTKPNDLHQLVFWVEDVPQTRQTLLEAGIVMGEVRMLEDGYPIAEGWDPAGHRFSIRS